MDPVIRTSYFIVEVWNDQTGDWTWLAEYETRADVDAALDELNADPEVRMFRVTTSTYEEFGGRAIDGHSIKV